MTSNSNLISQLNFIAEVDKMKSVLRANLLLDKSRRENDAEHSWHFALAALTLAEHAKEQIDINRVIKMALVHDLVEIYAGDTPCFDVAGNENKREKEKESANKLFALLPPEQGKEFRDLWEEFDKMETPDARFASAVDKFMPFFANSKTDGHCWVLYNVTRAQVYKRMSIVKDTIPELWKFIESVIEDAIEKGWIKE